MKIIAEKTELLTLIPQSQPMVMIDKLFLSNTEKTITGLTVSEKNIFVVNEKLKEPGIIENMAQTAAAKAGYEAKIENKPVKIGFIGAIKNLEINYLPKVGAELVTEMKSILELDGISVVQTKISERKNIVAQCEMKIFLM